MRTTFGQAVGAVGVLVVAVLALATAVVAQAPADVSRRLPPAAPGAPPVIPHDIESRKGLCVECHGAGAEGAPITPHPGRAAYCLACHVGQDPSAEPFESRATR